MNIPIRSATEADAAGLNALRRTLFAETPYLLWEAGEFQGTVEEEAHRIRQVAGRTNCLQIVAQDGDALVAVLAAFGGELRRRRHAAVLLVGVLRSHWGRGIATAMLRQAVDWAGAAGVTRLELTVHASNLPAIALYLRCGFRWEGTRRTSLMVDGRAVDEYAMALITES